ITPVAELSLILFDTPASDFIDEDTNEEVTITDEAEITFLNGTDTQKYLVRADFFFEFTNSISRSFDVIFEFLDTDGNSTYTIEIDVAPGTLQSPRTTIREESVVNEDIIRLTQANRVRSTVTIPSSNVDLEGNLKLKSKATLYLEIDTEQ
ncbi:MAG: hypothetical protein ACPGU0_02505, partial [Marinirhabdus sp.]